MDKGGYVFLLLSCILFIALIVGTFLYYRRTAELIEPDRCPFVTGSYGVNPGTIGRTLFVCGQDSKSECIFNSIPDVASATKLCNSYLNVCKAFSYSPNAKSVRFVDAAATNGSTFYDTYILQNRVSS